MNLILNLLFYPLYSIGSSSYECLRAVIDSRSNLTADKNVKLVMLFDHEEVGSASCQGGGSSLFMDTITRIHASLGDASHGDLLRYCYKIFMLFYVNFFYLSVNTYALCILMYYLHVSIFINNSFYCSALADNMFTVCMYCMLYECHYFVCTVCSNAMYM